MSSAGFLHRRAVGSAYPLTEVRSSRRCGARETLPRVLNLDEIEKLLRGAPESIRDYLRFVAYTFPGLGRTGSRWSRPSCFLELRVEYEKRPKIPHDCTAETVSTIWDRMGRMPGVPLEARYAWPSGAPSPPREGLVGCGVAVSLMFVLLVTPGRRPGTRVGTPVRAKAREESCHSLSPRATGSRRVRERGGLAVGRSRIIAASTSTVVPVSPPSQAEGRWRRYPRGEIARRSPMGPAAKARAARRACGTTRGCRGLAIPCVECADSWLTPVR